MNAPLLSVNLATGLTVLLYPFYVTYRYLTHRGQLSVRDAFR